MASGLDPEIANLLDDTGPDLDMNNPQDDNESGHEFLAESFPPLSAMDQKPADYFSDPQYYKKVLTGEGEVSTRIHQTLAKFLKAETSEDKTAYRNRIIGQFWELARNIAPKVGPSLITPKRLMLRYGILLPTLISKEQRQAISTVIDKNITGQPIHYVDEWLAGIARGDITPSASDEVSSSKAKHTNTKARNQLEKARGTRDSNKTIIETKQAAMMNLEQQLKDQVDTIMHHSEHRIFDGLKDTYDSMQKKALNKIVELVKELNNQDRDVSGCFHRLEKATNDFNTLQTQLEELGEDFSVDSSVIIGEFDNIRQMAKMCVGRQGNHFPILMKQYCPPSLQMIATRENIIETLRKIERLDPSVFKRTHRQQTSRIVPYIILIGCYGDKGICWEPFDRFNRATSRGRIAIPMFPKDIFTAVLYAVADLRWQVAKEKAAHYWMEEGLTGHYYMSFSDRKLKGDVRIKFIEDYILWITKESEGVQKLDKEVRGIFWRDMPFPQDVKDNLRNRGFAYNELYKKDQNRSMSAGY